MDTAPSIAPGRRPAWKLSLSTALIGVAAAAIWLAYFASRRELVSLSAKLPPLRDAARTFRFNDPALLSAYRSSENEFVLSSPMRLIERDIWQLYVPPQPRYEIRLATRGIGPDGVAEQFESAELPPGEHTLWVGHSASLGESAAGFMPGGSDAAAFLDEISVIKVDEAAAWFPGDNVTSATVHGGVEDHPPEQPLVLYRLRFHEPGAAEPPAGPANGVLLWIQPL